MGISPIRTLTVALCIVATSLLHAQQPFLHTGLDAGYYDMYNLDFPAAHQVFTRWIADHPQDPLGPASDAAAFLFTEFDRLGVLQLELFADPDRFDARSRPTPDAHTRDQFLDRIQQSDKLALAALHTNPRDTHALYTRTLLMGLRSQYAALIEKRDFTALRYTEDGNKLAKQTLALDPTLYDANIAVGVENYTLSLKPGILRFFFALRGDETSKEEGIRLMRLTAEHGHYLAPFAKLMLAVAEIKDNHPQQARDLLASLAHDFPQNTLYANQLARIH